MVKLSLSLVMICAEAMPRGGTVSVALEDRRLVVTGAGQGAMLAEEKKVALAGDAGALTARLVQPYYAGALARSLGSIVVAEAATDRVVLTAALPPA